MRMEDWSAIIVNTSVSSAISSALKALCTSGRLSVTMATPARVASNLIRSYSESRMAVFPLGGFLWRYLAVAAGPAQGRQNGAGVTTI